MIGRGASTVIGLGTPRAIPSSLTYVVDAISGQCLEVTSCMNIIGHGLEPMCNSTVLEKIDLGLVECFESPVIEGETMLSESSVLPILQSIVDIDGSSLKHLVLSHKWSVGDLSQLLSQFQFVESYSRHLNGCSFRCADENCEGIIPY
mmetsp:Transcript_6724/g.11979  ORF Transcript_6724/g.11979 Transcript_6724/m.11979 type:complete len:148 (+) Transcript_6724:897-1340(+)